MKIKNKSSLSSKYWLLIFAAICILLLGIGRFAEGSGPLRFIANYTIIPMQKGINQVGGWMSIQADKLENLSAVMAENEELKQQVDQKIRNIHPDFFTVITVDKDMTRR